MNSKVLQKNTKNSNEFFNKLSTPRFNKTPVLMSFLTLIIVVNLFLILLPFIFTAYKPMKPSHLVLFANHPKTILTVHQYWRLFTFFLAENMNGIWNILFSFIFLWIIFIRVGYFQEIIIGSKKTAFIWILSIFFLGCFQLFLTKNDFIYYYGTKYLGWIAIGCLFYVLLFRCKNNDQLRIMIRGLLLRSIFFLFIFEFLQYQAYVETTSVHYSPLVYSVEYYIYFSVSAFIFGFFASMLTNFKELEKFTQNTLLLFFAIILIMIIVFAILNYVNGVANREFVGQITEDILAEQKKIKI